jgi:hypothetical protein
MENMSDTGANLDPAKPKELNRGGGLAKVEACSLYQQYRARFELALTMLTAC